MALHWTTPKLSTMILQLKSEKTNVEAEIIDMNLEKKSDRGDVLNSLAKIANWQQVKPFLTLNVLGTGMMSENDAAYPYMLKK